MPPQSFPGPPPGTYSSPGSPQLGPPAGGSSQKFQTPIPATPGGNPNDSAPLWDGGASRSDGGLVPAPHGDPNDLGAPNTLNERNARPMLSHVSGSDADDTSHLQPANLQTSRAQPARVEAPDSFEAPLELDDNAHQHTAASGPNPYDYDREGYSWLRGVVDFNDDEKTWHIIYNVKPTKDDKFGGGIRLLPSPALKSLRQGQVVHLEGAIDYEHRDADGKPQYRVEHLARVEADRE